MAGALSVSKPPPFESLTGEALAEAGRPGALRARVEAARAALERSAGTRGRDLVVSPYRICPLGAHSDHQHGPVLGLAIDLHTVLVSAPRDDARVRLWSADFPGEVTLDLRAPAGAADATHEGGDASSSAAGWGRYVRGAAAVLGERLPRRPRGLDGRLSGALPGGGLSSSASTVVALLLALARANDVPLGAAELVTLARRAENEFAGVACGVLDPACVVGGRRGQLLRIDTARTRWEPVAGPPDAAPPRFLVASTGIARHLADTDFNRRVDECHAAAAALGALAGLAPAEGPGAVRRLGELDDAVFEAHGPKLPEAWRRRAAHFFGERRRVEAGVRRWREGALAAFGRLMNASCESSVRLYETGSPELVALQEIWEDTPGVLGARFSGAGFGGCSVALAEAGAAEPAAASVARRFAAAFPALAGRVRVLAVGGEDGARVLSLS